MGRADWTVAVGGAQPVRRRFHARAFNHFLHPRSQVSSRILVARTIGDPVELIVDRSVAFNPVGSNDALAHFLEDEIRIEVETTGSSTVSLLLESTHFLFAALGTPSEGDRSSFEVVVTEVEAEPLVVGTPRNPLENGPRREFPGPHPGCGESRSPIPLPRIGLGILMEAEVAKGPFVVLRGPGFDANTQVQFEAGRDQIVEALEVRPLGPDRVQVRAPLLGVGPLVVRTRSRAVTGYADTLLAVPHRTPRTALAPPLSEVVAAVDDGSRRFIASRDAVMEVTPAGFQAGPRFAEPPGLIRDLFLSSERPGELWAATSDRLFRALPGQAFEPVLAGDFRTVQEPRRGLVVAGGRPTLTLGFGGGESLRTWEGNLTIERLAFGLAATQPLGLAISDNHRLWSSARGGREPWEVRQVSGVRDVAASPRACGAYLAVGDNRAFQSRDGGLEWAFFEGEGQRLLTAGSRVFSVGRTRISEWFLDQWIEIAQLPTGFRMTAASVSPDGARMDLYGSTGRLVLEAAVQLN